MTIFESYSKKFSWWNLLNRLIVELHGNIREWILLGHEFGFGSISSKVITAEPVMDDIDIRLKVWQVNRLGNRFVKSSVISYKTSEQPLEKLHGEWSFT